MRLADFMEELAYGELSDLSHAEDGMVIAERQPGIVIKVNDVLNQLYIKYIIKLVATTLVTTVKTKSYTLIEPNSVRIIYVRPDAPDDTTLYERNDRFVLSGNTITFDRDEGPISNLIHIMYQYKPNKLILNPANPAYKDQEIDLPSELVPLARTLVASSVFTNMNGELHKKTGAELFNQAQFMQNELELAGILVTSVGFDSNTFFKNGFA